METIEFKNNFGLLFESHFCVMQSGKMKNYTYRNFRKIRLFKARNYQYNLLLIMMAFIVSLLGYVFRTYDFLFLFLGISLGLALLVASYRIKKYNYHLHMVTLNYEPIMIQVDSEIHEEAKTIVRKLNRKINLKPVYLKAV